MKCFYPILLVFLVLISCKKKDGLFLSTPNNIPGNTMVESFDALTVVPNFDFRTSMNVELVITDSQLAFYDIY